MEKRLVRAPNTFRALNYKNQSEFMLSTLTVPKEMRIITINDHQLFHRRMTGELLRKA